MQINKYGSKEVQNEKSLLEYFLVKIGEVKFQIGEVDSYVNGRGCMIVALAMEFKELRALLTLAENKIVQIRSRFLDDGSISMKKD